MSVKEHACKEAPTEYCGFGITVVCAPDSSKWNLEAYLADEEGTTESSFTVRDVRFCPWCGERLRAADELA